VPLILADNTGVKRILCSLLMLTLGLNSLASAQLRLKTSDSAQVNSGYIARTVVLTDDRGEIFLEFLKGDRVAKTLDNQIYEGEILPPTQIDAPARPPRARMRELLSFELQSDTSEEVELVDQYTAIHAKRRLRLSLQEGREDRSQGAQLITLFPAQQNVGYASLWRYDESNLNTPWERLGGILGDASETDTQVFSAFLYATGTYTIWDENPNPIEFEPDFPLDEIEYAEASPYPSVVEKAKESVEDFVDNIFGEEAVSSEQELNPQLSLQAPSQGTTSLEAPLEERIIPAVEPPTAIDPSLIPPVTSQLPAATTVPAVNTTNPDPLSNLRAIQGEAPSPLGSILNLPDPNSSASPFEVQTPINEAGLAENLQASAFQNFGVEEGDLPEAGGFRLPWALLFVLGIIGFSVYAIRQKPY